MSFVTGCYGCEELLVCPRHGRPKGSTDLARDMTRLHLVDGPDDRLVEIPPTLRTGETPKTQKAPACR